MSIRSKRTIFFGSSIRSISCSLLSVFLSNFAFTPSPVRKSSDTFRASAIFLAASSEGTEKKFCGKKQ